MKLIVLGRRHNFCESDGPSGLTAAMAHLAGATESALDEAASRDSIDAQGDAMSNNARRYGRNTSALSTRFDLELLESRTLLSGDLYVVNNGAEEIQEYSTSGATIDGALVTQLKDPNAITVAGNDIFETNFAFGTIGEYTTSGAVVNAALVSGLTHPEGIVVSGSNLFVADFDADTVAEYTTAGALVNAAFISGLNGPTGIALSGSDLYVCDALAGTINEYTLTGTVVAAPLVSGLTETNSLTVAGGDVFATSASAGTVGEYDATTGAPVNTALVSGLDDPFGIAVDGSNIYVADHQGVGEFTTSGTAVNATLINGLTEVLGIAFVSVTPPPAAGSPDTTFNNGNPVSLTFAAQASAVTSGGQTLLAGLESASNGNTTAVLEQLNPDGSLDTTFGSAGLVTDTATADEAFYGLVTEPDGTIVTAGTSNNDLLLAGYNANGSVDASFGSNGRVVLPITGASGTTAFGITTDANGNLVVVGSAAGQFLADRFSPGGVQDPAFNDGAPLVFGDSSDGDVLGKVAVASTGDIIAAGASSGSVVVVRLTPSGALDSSFGTGGIIPLSQLTAPDLLGQPDYTEGLTIDSQNRILVANTNAAGDFAVARLTSAGYLDSTFGTGGIVATNFGGTDDADFVAVQPDGSQILVAGTTTTNGVVSALIAAYTPTGILDTTFGNAGTQIIGASPSATPTDLLVGPVVFPQAEGIGSIIQKVYGTYGGGKVTVGKSTNSPGSSSGVVQRFNTPAPTDTPLSTGTLSADFSGKIPSAIIGGTKTKTVVPVIVKNPGSQLISGPITVTIFFSLGQSLGGATRLAAATPKVRLKSAAHAVVQLKIPTIPVLPAGIYYLIAEVNAPDGSITGIAGQTTTISPPFLLIAISAVTPPAAAVTPGKPASYSFTLQNQGNIAAAATVQLTLAASPDTTVADGQTITTMPSKISLKAAQLHQFRLPLRLAKTFPAGQYYLIVSLNLAALTDIVVPSISAFSATKLNVT